MRTGRTTTTRIMGSGFCGSPRIVSIALGTRGNVTRDSGHVLTIRVKVTTNSAKWNTASLSSLLAVRGRRFVSGNDRG